MRIAARNEANALYAKMAAESTEEVQVDVNVDLDAETNSDVAVFDGAWWDAWAREQAETQRKT